MFSAGYDLDANIICTQTYYMKNNCIQEGRG